MRGIREFVVALDRACRGADLRYAFTGALAVAAWGQPRASDHLDALVRVGTADASRLSERLALEGLSTGGPFDEALLDGRDVAVVDPESKWRVELKAARGPFEEAQVEFAAEIAIDASPSGAQIFVARAEETISSRLKSGSPQDWADARSILVRRRGRHDRTRIERLVLQLGAEEEWKRLRREAGEP